MDLGLSGKTALVLGAGGGLGSAIARTLAREGAHVALADIDAAAAGRVADEICATGARAIALQWDLGDLAVIDGNLSRIERELGAVDVLVNNTGGPPPTRCRGRAANCGGRISTAWCCRSSPSQTACCPACANASSAAS
jgi:3-oxoacyl-[acyl-carrier protein] reductase